MKTTYPEAVERLRKALSDSTLLLARTFISTGLTVTERAASLSAEIERVLSDTANLAPSSEPEPQLCDFGNQDDFDEAHDDWARAKRYAEIGAMEYNGNTVSYMYSKARNYGNVLVECCGLLGGDGHIKDRIKALIAERDELRNATHPASSEAQAGQTQAMQQDHVLPPTRGTDSQQVSTPFDLALDTQHPQCHQAANAFWNYWKANGETHKRGYYESTWGAINQALKLVGVRHWTYGGEFEQTQPAGAAKGGMGELTALRSFVLEVSRQDPGQSIGQRQSNKERAEDLCEQWGITE